MTRKFRTTMFAIAAIVVSTGLVGAAEEKQGRYSMSPTEGGFVRLDTLTGEMSLCKRGGNGEWACEPMRDHQQAFKPNESPGAPPDDLAPPGDGPSAKIPIPTEQDVDKLFDYVEGMVKKLKERLKRLEEQKDKDTQL